MTMSCDSQCNGHEYTIQWDSLAEVPESALESQSRLQIDT